MTKNGYGLEIKELQWEGKKLSGEGKKWKVGKMSFTEYSLPSLELTHRSFSVGKKKRGIWIICSLEFERKRKANRGKKTLREPGWIRRMKKWWWSPKEKGRKKGERISLFLILILILILEKQMKRNNHLVDKFFPSKMWYWHEKVSWKKRKKRKEKNSLGWNDW